MNKEWKTVYVGIGSNKGRRNQNIAKALSLLAGHPDLQIEKTSPFYETEPVGGPKQRNFINGVICLKTRVQPEKLFDILKTVEKKTGRSADSVRWGPRVMDLDILFFENKVISGKKLVIPHPLLDKRWFVLKPLSDVAPRLEHPVLKKTVMQMLKGLEARAEKI